MESAEGEHASGSSNSGKLVIVSILTVAFLGAAVSWYFRYRTTHRAAKFWGPEMATLIRDAPKVILFEKPTGKLTFSELRDPLQSRANFDKSAHDISHGGGLLHLRNALLEDQNFDWSTAGEPSEAQYNNLSHWVLTFHDPKSHETALIMFSDDCRLAAREERVFMHLEVRSVSTQPMAKGLREIFAEFTARSAADGGAKPQAAKDAVEPAR